MEQKTQLQYTTAFISITLSGELSTIMQFQGTLIECAKWRREHREELEKLYGEIQSVTIKHKR